MARPVLLYEAGCPFCRWAATVVAGLDRRGDIALLAMESDEAAPLLEPLPEEERFATWQLVRPDGSLVSHGTGIVALLASMSLTRPLAPLLGRPRLVAVLDRLDAVISRNRKRLGRFVPS
jgi:predicted DCC family thiol-disulfide oxidoreductase YuxK